jgi:ribosomal protein S18 acetylase RimI-like enzyme
LEEQLLVMLVLMVDLRRIQDSIQTPPPGALRVIAGAFAVMVHPENPLPWFNDAVPEAEPTDDDVTAMVTVFRQYGRRPRLEFLRELWPTVPALLVKHGFRLKDTQPALAVTRGEWSRRDAGAPLVRLAKPEDAGVIDAMGNIAFAGDGAHPLREAAIRESLAAGRSRAAIAYIKEEGGVPLAEGGSAIGSGRIVGVPDVREIVSIGTLPAFRGRGVASAVTAFLVEDFFANGGEIAWLTATPEADGVYRRVGFTPIANQVCYVLD